MAQGQPFWDDHFTPFDEGPYVGETFATNTWDTATIAGRQIPGLVTVNCSRSRHLDVVTKPGTSPWIRTIGFEPLRFSMSIQLWTPRQWAAMQDIGAFLMKVKQDADVAAQQKRRKSKNATDQQRAEAGDVFDVYHPALAFNGVSQAVCLKLGPLVGAQIKTLTIEFLEQRKGKTKVQNLGPSVAVDNHYDATALASQSVQAQNGNTTNYTPAQGPKVPPSQSGVSLTPTP